MTGSVDGYDSNILRVKLFNGQYISLNRLDKLFQQSIDGSIFKDYDSADKGGNANHRFDADEISKIKQLLLEYQANDGVITQDELNEMFGYNKKDKKENFNINDLNYLADKVSEDFSDTKSTEDNSDTKKPTGPQTQYVVQPGDTIDKIVKKLGLTGEEAKTYSKNLKAKLVANNQLSKQGWLKVGQKIMLDGDYAQVLKNDETYSEDINVLRERYKAATKVEEKQEDQVDKKQEDQVDKNAPKDALTKAKNKQHINTIKNQGLTNANAIKNQIRGISNNNNTRVMLNEKINNQNIAYVIENYPELVSDIDAEVGMDNIDIKKYVVNPLNARLKELGLNKLCIRNADKLSADQLEKRCQQIAQIIRQTDEDNGFVFVPSKGNEGKLHYPRKAEQYKDFYNPSTLKRQKENKLPQTKDTAKPTNFNPIASFDQNKRQATTIPYREGVVPKPLEERPTTQKIKSKSTLTDSVDVPTSDTSGAYTRQLMYKLNIGIRSDYPKRLQEKLIELNKSGAYFKVNKTDKGYQVEVKGEIPQFDGKNFTNYLLPNNHIKSNIYYMDEQGNIEKQVIVTNTESRTITYDKLSNVPLKTKIYKKNAINYSSIPQGREIENQDRIPTNIKITRPKDITTEGKQYANALESQKSDLMKCLNITNEQYNNLANIAMAIAEQETHFGAKTYIDSQGNEHRNTRYNLKDSALGDIAIDSIYGLGIKKGVRSYGLTQAKVDLFISDDNPALKAQFAAFGIYSGEDINDDPQKQAIATMIILNNKRIVAESETWQKYLEQNNSNISRANDEITTNDLIALLYNGNTKVLNRLKSPNDTVRISDTNDAKGENMGTHYARFIRKYSSKYSVSTIENTDQQNREIAFNMQTQGNNGALGTVIFMPNLYNNNVINDYNSINILERALNKLQLQETDKDNLLNAVRNGEIAFGYNLTEAEANSLTINDVRILLNQLQTLKTQISENPSADILTLARQTQDNFRSEYLQSRQVSVNIYDLGRESSVLTALRNPNTISERLIPRGERKIVVNSQNVNEYRAGSNGRSQVTQNNGRYFGFGVEEDKGINPYDANNNLITGYSRELAECASDVAQMMDCGGNCATAVKASMESAKILTAEQRTNMGYEENGKWIRCDQPRKFPAFFANHPEAFEEIKYLSNGDGSARELNASDILNLPAGYIVVFIPGEGYEHEAGHALITNGNGQGYADEVDNLRWDDFKSGGRGNGKGEHGTYRIYRVIGPVKS